MSAAEAGRQARVRKTPLQRLAADHPVREHTLEEDEALEDAERGWVTVVLRRGG